MEKYISCVAVKGDYKIGLGYIGGSPAIIAKTPNGEGATYYPTWVDASNAYDEIVKLAELVRL